MYDRWMCNSTLYVTVLGSYCVDVATKSNFNSVTTSTPRIRILTLSRMNQIVLPENYYQSILTETTTFNAEAHVNFFEESFQEN